MAGTQPIRVLFPIVIYMFQNTYREFSKDLMEAIAKGELNENLDIQYGEVSIWDDQNGRYRTPCLLNDSREIQLHETFCSYQWCVTYAVYVLFLETIDFPLVNKSLGYEKHPITKENIEKAKEVFSYGKFIIALYEVWNRDELPNPETYMAEKRDYVEQTNIFYTESIKFILLHEYVHAIKHISGMPQAPQNSYFLEMEKEADEVAMNMSLQGKNELNSLAIECGSILGILSMIFFRETTTGTKHPNVEDRLTWALEKMQIGDNEYGWAMACIGLELWAEQWGLHFNWDLKGEIPYKYLYYDIVAQIKKKEN